MQVIVDTGLCEVHGECVVMAPEVFDIGDDDAVVQVVDPEPAEELRSKVEAAATLCPVAAITVLG